MGASRLGATGLIGFLVFLAGLHLLWQSRGEVLYWTDEFLRIFRKEFSERGGIGDRAVVPPLSGHRIRGTLRMMAAFALMLLGPLLFLLDLRF